MKILMATDGSANAEAALHAATRIVAPGERTADVVCVVPAPPAVLSGIRARGRDRFQRKMMAEAHARVDAAKSILARGGWLARPVIREGAPATVLVEMSGDYDLTVAGALGHRTQTDLPLGPVATRLSEHGGGCVLIARTAPGEDVLRILVPVDGSAAALRALDRLRELVGNRGVEVSLLHVVETPWLHLGLEQEWFGYLEREEETGDEQASLEKEMRDEASGLLEQARARWPGGVSDVLTREGNPAREILAESERGQYDLVALSASGSSDFKHTILGSVSAAVTRDAGCSVLLIRPGSEPV